MIMGRCGHARVVVLAVIPEEFDAVQDEFGAHREVGSEGVFAPEHLVLDPEDGVGYLLPFVIAQCYDRSNTPAMSTANFLLEQWRPEFIVLCGIAGGIRRGEPDSKPAFLDGPENGDVVVAKYVHYADYGKTGGGGFDMRYIPVVHPPTTVVNQHTQALLRHGTVWPDHVLALHPDGIDGKRPNVLTGEIVAVESIAGDPTSPRQKWLIDTFVKAIAVDMESYGVARALHDYNTDVHYHPRWLCVRGISDSVVGSEADQALLGEANHDQRDRWKPYAAATAAHIARLIVERLLSRPRQVHIEQPGAPAWSHPGAPNVSVPDETMVP